MSSLTKTSISSTTSNSLHFTITSIHPDATMNYFETRGKEMIIPTVLYMLTDLLERERRQKSKLYRKLQEAIKVVFEEEDREYDGDNITDYEAPYVMEQVGDMLLTAIKILESNLNDNWENGIFDGLSYLQMESEPYLSKLPSITILLQFKESVVSTSLEGIKTTTSLDTNLMEWL